MHGRLWRLFWSIEAGVTVAALTAAVLPAPDGLSVVALPLVPAGACGIAMAIYAALHALARRPKRRVVNLPRARLLRA